MRGILGSLFRQPEHKVQEPVTELTQIGIPKGRSMWAGLFAFIAIMSFAWLAWITPPGLALDFAWIVFFVGACVTGALVIVYWHEADRRGFYALLTTVVLAAMSWYLSSRSDTWWGVGPPWSDLGMVQVAFYAFGVAGLIAGVSGCYYFLKETIVPWELTGINRVLKSYLDKYGDAMALSEFGVVEVDGMSQEEMMREIQGRVSRDIKDGLKDAQRIAAKPLRRDSTATLRKLSNAIWHIDALAFLLIVWLYGGNMSRNELVDSRQGSQGYLELPSGLIVKDKEYRVIIHALDAAGVIELASRRGPQLANNLSAEEMAQAITYTDVPEGLSAHYG
jgi:hypothetical protein